MSAWRLLPAALLLVAGCRESAQVAEGEAAATGRPAAQSDAPQGTTLPADFPLPAYPGALVETTQAEARGGAQVSSAALRTAATVATVAGFYERHLAGEKLTVRRSQLKAKGRNIVLLTGATAGGEPRANVMVSRPRGQELTLINLQWTQP